jgi:hypothetical protein
MVSMAHTIYVDLSAKVEQWSKDTAVAFSNDGIMAVRLVSSKTKRLMREHLQEQYPNHAASFYVYLINALVITVLIAPYIHHIDHIVIDQDYPGSRSKGMIELWMMNLIRRLRPQVRGGLVDFRNIKGSRADRLAREMYQRKRGVHGGITLDEMMTLLPNKKDRGSR